MKERKREIVAIASTAICVEVSAETKIQREGDKSEFDLRFRVKVSVETKIQRERDKSASDLRFYFVFSYPPSSVRRHDAVL